MGRSVALPRLSALQDVDLSGIANGDLLTFNSTTEKWARGVLPDTARSKIIPWARQVSPTPDGVDIYHPLAWSPTAGGSITVTANQLRAWPFWSGRGGIIGRFRAFVAGAAASNFRFGLYTNDSDTNIFPKDLIVDFGDRDGAVAGAHDMEPGGGITLDSGTIYWGAYNGSVASQPGILGLTGHAGFLGNDIVNQALTQNPAHGLRTPLAYGALPAVFPVAGVVRMGASTGGTTLPGLWARYSA